MEQITSETRRDWLSRASHRSVAPGNLESFAIDVLSKAGLPQKDAQVVAEVLVTTDTWGIHSHGTYHLANYVNKIRAQGISPQSEPIVISEGQGWALIDGRSTIAMVTSCKAMNLAISKATTAGIAYIGVRNSNHFGAAGYYANMAAMRGMIGIAMSNGNPNMNVPGARGAVIGNNPLAYAAPLSCKRSIMMDIATSTVAASKVLSAKSLGKQIPDTWIVDDEGVPTTDLSKFPTSCSLQPMGGHKGYGIAFMIEILAGALSGGRVIDEIESWLLNLADQTSLGHAFIAVNVDRILPMGQFMGRMEKLVQGIRQAPMAKGEGRLYLPGEKEWDNRENALKTGLKLPKDVLANLYALAEDEGLSVDSIFS